MRRRCSTALKSREVIHVQGACGSHASERRVEVTLPATSTRPGYLAESVSFFSANTSPLTLIDTVTFHLPGIGTSPRPV